MTVNTNGVSTNGVTAKFRLFDRGTFWVLPLTYFYLPKKVPGRTFFPNLSKYITFAAAPSVLTPFVRNQGPLLGHGPRCTQARAGVQKQTKGP